MKRQRINTWWFAVGMFVLVCAGLYWLTCYSPVKALQGKNPSVKIYYETNTPTPVSSVTSKVHQRTPTPQPEAREEIQDATGTFNLSQPRRYFFCSIHDVLGESVEHGIIQYATHTIPFQNGHLRLERGSLPAKPFVLAASAQGYQAATQTIDLQNTSEAEFTLDYYCNFSIQVYNGVRTGSGQEPVLIPHPGATVTLFRSKPCPRPLRHSQRTLVEVEASKYPSIFEFEYEDREITALRSNASKFRETFNLIIDEMPNMFHRPRAGDKLLTIGTRDASLENGPADPCKSHQKYHGKRFDYVLPLPRINSRNARIMDTLHVSAKQRTASMAHAEIRFSRNDRWYTAKCLYLPTCGGGAQPIAQTVSNERGECRFEKLPPGLYYAQAAFEGRRSMIRPLFPTSGGAKLILDNSCTLHIHTLREGVIPDCYYLLGEKVPNTSVALRPKDGTSAGFFSTKTNRYGGAVINSIPFGTYTVTANPEEKANLSPVRTEISIDQPDQTLDIGFNDWTRHSIEGTVVEYDTRAPIPDIYLELYEYRWGQFCPSACVTTDADGAFAFHNLPEGKYKIVHHPSAKEDHLYYYYEMNSNSPPDYAPFYQAYDRSKLIFIKDDPVYTIQLEMIGTVATRFSGQAVNESGNPVSGANVQLLRHAEYNSIKSIALPHGKIYSDENGEFEITIWTRNLPEYNEKTYQGRVFASIVTSNPITPDETARSIDRIGQNLIPEKTGFLNFPFVFGDNKENLRVVVSGSDYFTLEGRLRTEDGRIPDGANVYLSFYSTEMDNMGQEIWGTYNPQTGGFSIRGAKNEPFGIWVKGAYVRNEDRTLTEYLDEHIGIYKAQARELYQNSKSGQEKIKIEITLKECGYLSGRVLDKDRNPMPRVAIQTGPNIHTSKLVHTDKEGKFRISPLEKEKTYSLYVGKMNDTPPILLMPDVQPPMDNIILIWKEEE